MSRFAKILNHNPSSEIKENPIPIIQSPSNPNFEEIKLRHMLDPREDLKKDSRIWVRVLYNAYHLNREVYGVLHGLRCGGAQKVITSDSFKLLPGEWTISEWEENKQKYLNPIKENLIVVFKTSRMGQVIQEEVPEGIFAQRSTVQGQRLIFGANASFTGGK